MKRDWDCIRAILIALEDKGDFESTVRASSIVDFDPMTVNYNLRLLIQADLVEGSCSRTRSPQCVAHAMTWAGHELLDQVRSENVWNRVKGQAREQGQSLSFDLIKFLARRAIEGLFGG